MLDDLGLKKYNTMEFWATIMLLFLVTWFRVYLHYLGEWLYLQAMKIPVFEYTFKPYTVSMCVHKAFGEQTRI